MQPYLALAKSLKKTNINCTSKMRTKIFTAIALVILSLGAHSQILDTDYRLGSGDRVQIMVFGQEDLTVQTRLSNNGIIRYPFLGDIVLVGKSVNEVEQLIDEGLRGDYLIDPSVSVSVVEYRPFFIDGAVKKPGGYPYQPGLTIDKAAALAGGYTERASKGEVIIRRTIAGKDVELEYDANETIIMPGDIVSVQERFF
jgi:polysaccharide export outer membrane protein